MSENATGDLSMFVDPFSVAVVGASDDVSKWGHWLARGAVAGADRRRVALVNARAPLVLGRPAFRSVAEIPGPVDLVVLAVPSSSIQRVVDEALAAGARGFLAIGADIEDEAALAARIREGGGRLLGPNCLGIYDAAQSLHLVAWAQLRPGSLAIVSQSGQLGLELAALGEERGIGVSRFVSVGNQVDVTARDVLDGLVSHGETKAVVLYAESFGDGRALVAALGELRSAGKPVVVMTAGASEAGRSAARSHTGSLTAPVDVVAAACRASGAVLVRTPAEAIDAAQLLLRTPRAAGDRVAVLGDSGGQGAVAADLAVGAGLRVEPFSDQLRARLASVLPPHAGASNPVDLAGVGEQDIGSYAKLVSIAAASDEVDAVVLTGYFGRYGQDIGSLAAAELDVVAGIGATVSRWRKPVVLHSMARSSTALAALADAGVPSYPTIETAVGALAAARRLERSPGRSARLAPPLHSKPAALVLSHSYFAARTLLEAAGVAFPRALPVRDEDGVVTAARQLRPPLALKADWLAHKTEVGGVVLHLESPQAVETAYRELVGRLGGGRYVIEEMDTRPDVVEIIVGARRDASFGPVVTVGAGGVEAELERDVAVELAPVDAHVADQMVRRLRRSRLLEGWRGSPALDVGALVDVIVALSGILEANSGIDEIELNPVRVGTCGAVAVDAAAVLRPPTAKSLTTA